MSLKKFVNINVSDVERPKKFRALTKYTRNLTKLAQDNKLDPVIGRDTEVQRDSNFVTSHKTIRY